MSRSPDYRIVWAKFVGGTLFLYAVSLALHWVADVSVFVVFPIVFLGAILCCGLALAWITLWAEREESRLGQFTVGSFLFATFFVSAFLATVRWLLTLPTGSERLDRDEPIQAFLVVSVFCLALVCVSIPILVMFTESLVWLGAWMVRRVMRRSDR